MRDFVTEDDSNGEMPDDGSSGCDGFRQALLEAVAPAIVKLAGAARGEKVFETPEQMRACFALARLAPVLLADRVGEMEPQEYRTLTPDQEEAWRVLQRPFYGPGQPGCAILEDPTREPKWFSWVDSCRRAGLDPHDVFEEQEQYERARTD